MFDFTGPVTIHVHGPTEADLIAAVKAALHPLEEAMATEAEQITALTTKVDDLVSDVRAALAALEADRDNLGPDGQAALDALTAKVDAFDTEVGDADGSDTVPVEPTA